MSRGADRRVSVAITDAVAANDADATAGVVTAAGRAGFTRAAAREFALRLSAAGDAVSAAEIVRLHESKQRWAACAPAAGALAARLFGGGAMRIEVEHTGGEPDRSARRLAAMVKARDAVGAVREARALSGVNTPLVFDVLASSSGDARAKVYVDLLRSIHTIVAGGDAMDALVDAAGAAACGAIAVRCGGGGATSEELTRRLRLGAIQRMPLTPRGGRTAARRPSPGVEARTLDVDLGDTPPCPPVDIQKVDGLDGALSDGSSACVCHPASLRRL